MPHRCCVILLAVAAFGQGPQKTFEVASVKPASSSNSLDFRLLPGGRLHVTKQTLNVLIREAHSVERYQITGGPAWLDADRFDIEAKAEGEPTKAEMLAMLQGLLADRFQLKIRRETREGNVYVLTVAKGGPKLQPPTGDAPFIGLVLNDPIAGEMRVHYSLWGKKASLAMLATSLAQQLHAPVIDRSGLAGEFDFKVDFAIGDDPDAGVALPQAVQQQLGLKLEAAKGPVETLVVEHAAKPAAN